MNPICGCMLCQHALGDCTIKFESNSFRTLLSAGYNSFQVFDAVEDAGEVSSLPSKSAVKVCRQSQSQSQSQKSEGTKRCPNFLK